MHLEVLAPHQKTHGTTTHSFSKRNICGSSLVMRDYVVRAQGQGGSKEKGGAAGNDEHPLFLLREPFFYFFFFFFLDWGNGAAVGCGCCHHANCSTAAETTAPAPAPSLPPEPDHHTAPNSAPRYT